MTVVRSLIILTMLIASVGLCAAAFQKIPVRIVKNVTESAPLGYYWITQREVRRGEFVLVAPAPELIGDFAARGYLSPNAPLIKQVAAGAGDTVCREETRILINDAHVADALRVDSQNRPMPSWRGCKVLSENEVFLLNRHPQSLDGRYFGVTNKKHIIGAASFIGEPSNALVTIR